MQQWLTIAFMAMLVGSVFVSLAMNFSVDRGGMLCLLATVRSIIGMFRVVVVW